MSGVIELTFSTDLRLFMMPLLQDNYLYVSLWFPNILQDVCTGYALWLQPCKHLQTNKWALLLLLHAYECTTGYKWLAALEIVYALHKIYFPYLRFSSVDQVKCRSPTTLQTSPDQYDSRKIGTLCLQCYLDLITSARCEEMIWTGDPFVFLPLRTPIWSDIHWTWCYCLLWIFVKWCCCVRVVWFSEVSGWEVDKSV